MRSSERIGFVATIATLLFACWTIAAPTFAADLTPIGEGQLEIPNEILELDEITVRSEIPKRVFEAMEPIHSMAGVIALLDRNGITFERSERRISLRELGPSGEPVVDVTAGKPTTISVIKRRIPVD